MTGPNHSSKPAETEGKSVANTPKKKLIETSLPLEAINAASAREKSIRHGHPSTLHLYWSRKPLATARAVLFAQHPLVHRSVCTGYGVPLLLQSSVA